MANYISVLDLQTFKATELYGGLEDYHTHYSLPDK